MADVDKGARKRESHARYRAKMTDEDKERRNMRTYRVYYQKKGIVPHEYTALGKWCVSKGYDIGAVMRGEQAI
jgi:hypothetical protein